MSFLTPSVGDILMLSQLVWRIGCAFTAGRASAPAQFQEIENELKGLNTAIMLLAETLDEDGSLLQRADNKTKEGLDKILGCCRQTLDSLESFVTQYQEIKRSDEHGGLASRRTWRQVLVRHYKTITWTTEGGDIQQLRNKLQMHTQSISLTMQALQSRSLSRLEKVIEPVADQIDEMHSRLNGDLDVKIEDIHQVMLSLKSSMDNGSSIIWPEGSRAESTSSYGSPSTSPTMKPRRAPTYKTLAEPRERQPSYASSRYMQTPEMTPELSDSEFSVQSPISSARASGHQMMDRRESTLIPLVFQDPTGDMPPEYERRVSNTSEGALYSPTAPFRRRESEYQRPSTEPKPLSLFPSPPMPMLPPPAVPTDSYMDYNRQRSYSLPDEPRISESTVLPANAATVEEQEAFEKIIFTGATILCEVRAELVDYTQPNPEIQGEWMMVEACKACKVCIVTRNEKTSNGALQFKTSVWVLSENRGTRLQQELLDGVEVIPYTVWGNEKKVVLRVPTELKFHDTIMDAKPVSVAQTSWINFNFESERAASNFQSALMGKLLLLSVQTKRTMRVFDGISGTFAFAEQLCGLENLRVFQDEQTGGILAMLHYSPQFFDGYLAFHLNSTQFPLRLRDEDEKTLKIKGLNIIVDEKHAMLRRDSTLTEKKSTAKNKNIIKAVKIEFSNPEAKAHFKNTFKEIQARPERFV